MISTLTTSLLSLTLASPALAGGSEWQTNMDKAMELAQQDGKMLLIDFTGSDWCHWCIKLNEEVFSKESFKYSAPKDFVLVELDFPSKKPQTDEVKAHNKVWSEKYQIEGFPTIVLADPQGEAFAMTGYRPDGPEPYLEHLSILLEGKKQRDMHLEMADKTEGLDKARHLDQALSVENIIVPDRVKVMEQIIELDSDNTAELRDKYQADINMIKAGELMQEINELLMNEKLDEAVTLIDQVLKDVNPSGEMLLELTAMKVYVLKTEGNTEGALELVKSTLDREDLSTEDRQMLSVLRWQVISENEDEDASTQALKDAIAVDPESDFARQLKQILEQQQDK